MMTPQEAYQEFFDNAFHRTMKPQISEDAKMIAIMALVEKIEREEKGYSTNRVDALRKEGPIDCV